MNNRLLGNIAPSHTCLFYEHPSVEVIDVEVEMGFALSYCGTNDDPGWGPLH